jgi:hypothetical protein
VAEFAAVGLKSVLKFILLVINFSTIFSLSIISDELRDKFLLLN